jgi:hypothetical protein
MGGILMNRYKKYSDALEAEARAEQNKPVQNKSVTETEASIAAIWKEQEDIRKRDEELEREYREAKARAKKLKIKVNQRKAIDTKDEVVSVVGERGYHFLRRTKTFLKTLPRRISARLSTFYLKRSKKQLAGLMVLSATLFGIVTWQGLMPTEQKNDTPEVTAVNGAVTEEPTFSLVYPAGKSRESLENVTRKSPGGDVIHTFKDTLNNTGIEVTMQEKPESFDLEKLAEDNYLANRIQVDSNIIYHGQDDTTGAQFLVTTKNNVLIFIRADQPLADDAWAGYYLSLQ